MGIRKNKSEIIDLIQKVRQGNQDAFERLLSQYEPLIDGALSKFCRDEPSSLHRDDLRQEAIIVFYNAILSYDICNDGVEFGLYAKICVTNALITQTRKLNKFKEEQALDTSDMVEQIDEQGEPSARIIEEESLEMLYSVIRENLSPLEYKVWCMYALGKTAKEIGAEVGKSEKSISNAVYRIRQKLRALLK